MVHIWVVLGTLWLTLRLLQWGKSFHLDELPIFNQILEKCNFFRLFEWQINVFFDKFGT